MQPEILKILFIINPILEKRFGPSLKGLIENGLNPALFAPAILYSDYPGHAKVLARQNLDRYQVIVAGGGDGTVNEVASQLIHTEVILGILPLGSGKGLARSLGIPMNIKMAIETLNDFSIGKIDTGRANEFRFINIAGIGFDAVVAHGYSNKTGRGFFTYAQQTARNLFQYAPVQVHIKTIHREISTHAFLVSFANSPQWGYGALISPDAKTNDGMLDLCLLRKFPRILSPWLVFRLFRGSIHKSKYVEIIPVKHSEIIGSGIFTGHIDGEPVEFTTPLKISVDPSSLKVILRQYQ